ncbi:MAG: ParB/RepB/Spo0J family partition protein [bacterium]|nr:ParB/RepB/Spo0J family partition protein [bacterium]
MPHYIVTLVKASAPAQKSAGPDVTASRTLEDFGFGPADERSRDNMNEIGATPSENIVVRYEKGQVSFFKLIRADKDGKKARLVELDAGRVFAEEGGNGSGKITIRGHGRKLLDYEITFESRALLDSALNTKAEIEYDNDHKGPRKLPPDGKRERARTSNIESARRPTTPPIPPPAIEKPQDKKPETVVAFPAQPELRLVPPSKVTATPMQPAMPTAEKPPETPPVLRLSATLVETAPQEPVHDVPATVSVSALEMEILEYVVRAKVGEIVPDPYQPREYFNEGDLRAMAESMKAEAQVVLIIVRPVPPGDHGAKYMIIDGECRWRAAQYAGIRELLILVRPNVDAKKAFRQSVISNFNRRGHTVRECLNVIKRLLADGCSVTETYTICGQEPSWYYKHIALEKLHADLLRLIDPPTEKKDRLPVSLARKLAYIPISEQKEAFHRIMLEPSARGRAELADELARPHMAVSTRNKPSDHLQSLERFVLTLRGGNKRNFVHAEVAVRALVINRKPDQVDALLAVVEESVTRLAELHAAIKKTRAELVQSV